MAYLCIQSFHKAVSRAQIYKWNVRDLRLSEGSWQVLKAVSLWRRTNLHTALYSRTLATATVRHVSQYMCRLVADQLQPSNFEQRKIIPKPSPQASKKLFKHSNKLDGAELWGRTNDQTWTCSTFKCKWLLFVHKIVTSVPLSSVGGTFYCQSVVGFLQICVFHWHVVLLREI